MRITPTGNVLIGTSTNSGFKLDVNGTGRFTDTITSTKTSDLVFTNASGGTNRIYTLLSNTSGYFLTGVEGSVAGSLVTGSTAYSGVITTNSTSDLVLGTNFTKRLSIDKSTGAATFSSSVTATELYLSTSSGLVGNINSSNANGGYLTWQTSGTTIADIGTAQQIFGAGGNDTFGINGRGARAIAFGTNNIERMRITSDGNVLIGTTTNGASKLRIVGLPTSSVGLSSGDVWSDLGTLKIA
jgi:hypothetical protein